MGRKKPQQSNKSSKPINTPSVPFNNGNDNADRQLIQPNDKTNTQSDNTKKEKREMQQSKTKWSKAEIIDFIGTIANVAIAFTAIIAVWIAYESLADTQQAFVEQNESNLQITNFTIDTFVIGKPIYFSFKLENFGSSPAKILGTKQGGVTKVNEPSFDELASDGEIIPVNAYFSSDNPISYDVIEAFNGRTLNTDTYNLIVNSNGFIYFIGIINYENVITKKQRVYKYKIRCRFKFEKNSLYQTEEYLVNDNDYVQK